MTNTKKIVNLTIAQTSVLKSVIDATYSEDTRSGHPNAKSHGKVVHAHLLLKVVSKLLLLSDYRKAVNRLNEITTLLGESVFYTTEDLAEPLAIYVRSALKGTSESLVVLRKLSEDAANAAEGILARVSDE